MIWQGGSDWRMISKRLTAVTVNGVATGTVVDSFTLPANTLQIGDLYRIKGFMSSNVVSGTPAAFAVAIRSNLTQIMTATMTPASNAKLVWECYAKVTNTTEITQPDNVIIQQQINNVEVAGGAINVTSTSGLTITSDQPISIYGTFTDVLQSLTVHWWTYEILRP